MDGWKDDSIVRPQYWDRVEVTPSDLNKQGRDDERLDDGEKAEPEESIDG